MTTHAILFGFGLSQLGMLWWLGAAAAPLLIHLLSRRKYREVPWAAVEYLLAAMQRSSRRLRTEGLILLAIRTLIVVAVVVAVAGPYLERPGGALAVGEPIHKVIVLDGSYSMAYKPAEQDRFQLARRLVEEIVAGSSQGDGFSLVLMAEPARIIVGTPAFVSDDVREALKRSQGERDGGASSAAPGDKPAAARTDAQRKIEEDDFIREVRNLRLPHAGGDLHGALDRVDEILARSRKEYPRLSRREIYFLTDLGRTSWDFAAISAGKKSRQRLAKLADDARLTIVDLGQEHCENLAITSLRSNQQVFTSRARAVFEAEVRNFGDAPHAGQIELWIDGQRFQSLPLAVKPAANKRFLSNIASKPPATMRSKCELPATRSISSTRTITAGSPCP